MRAELLKGYRCEMPKPDAEPIYTVVGNVKPRSICDSSLIDLLAELFKKELLIFKLH